MIYDGLSALPLYRGLSRGLDVLIDWLATHDPAELALGKTEIDGDRVFALAMESGLRTWEEARFEVHRRYMDVQVDLEGFERFATTPGEVVDDGPFDEAADKGYCRAAENNRDILEGSLENGRFAVFMVGEPHMPNLTHPAAGAGPIRKVCFKVLADEFWPAG